MMYVKATPTTDLNRNTDWFTYPGVWTTYIFIIFFSWLLILSVSGCSPGMAWTIVHFSHFLFSVVIYEARGRDGTMSTRPGDGVGTETHRKRHGDVPRTFPGIRGRPFHVLGTFPY
ncbi:putative ORMDL family protein [Helianthus annuus]|nr:putative ORMDL family protein [Helianthus annuus]